MRLAKILSTIALAALIGWQTNAQTYDTNGVVVQTFAGSGFYGYLDGVGQLTMFDYPRQIVADSQGNLFVWDDGNTRIRKIAPDATVTTFAGGGNQATGVGTNVSLRYFSGMAIDRSDTIWLLMYDTAPYLYRITSNANITRTGLSPLLSPQGICLDWWGNAYISDENGNKIYRYSTNGVLSVFAGSGNSGYADGNGIFTAFSHPSALACDAAGNIYVWDPGNFLVRRIDQSQNVTTFAGKYQNGSSADGVGTNAAISSISQMCVDASGNLLFVGGLGYFSVRRISPATNVTTIAGSFSQGGGYMNGAGNLARFNGPSGVCVSSGTIFVADSGNERIRSITNNPTAQPVLPADLQLSTYPGLRIVGTVGRTYQVQSSPDTTNWTTRATLLLNASPYLWIDQNPVSGNKFYRAYLLP